MATIHRFEDLEVWQRAREITKDIYGLCRESAFSRDFGLKDQICRSSESVMSNLAEGFERDGNREFVNFLSIAKGSCGEVRSHLYVALDQKYITQNQFDLAYVKCEQNSRGLSGLIKYLNQSEIKGRKFR